MNAKKAAAPEAIRARPEKNQVCDEHSSDTAPPAQGPLTLAEIDAIAGGRIGVMDAPCPLCGPDRRSPANRARRVLRIWRTERNFASFLCARCGAAGFVRDDSSTIRTRTNPAIRAEIERRDAAAKADRRRLANELWRRRRPAEDSPVARYLRDARGYGGPIPATIAYLPARGDRAHAMIAAFAVAGEAEPSVLTPPADVAGVHLTRLAPDGRGKLGDPAKIMIGASISVPIILAPPNDSLGLAISEGIEDGLSVYAATGLGVWAAGSASRMAALADIIPNFADCVSIIADPDDAGRRGAAALAEKARARGLYIEIRQLMNSHTEARP